MHLHTLLSGRPDILRQAHLANLALAYATLREFADGWNEVWEAPSKTLTRAQQG